MQGQEPLQLRLGLGLHDRSQLPGEGHHGEAEADHILIEKPSAPLGHSTQKPVLNLGCHTHHVLELHPFDLFLESSLVQGHRKPDHLQLDHPLCPSEFLVCRLLQQALLVLPLEATHLMLVDPPIHSLLHSFLTFLMSSLGIGEAAIHVLCSLLPQRYDTSLVSNLLEVRLIDMLKVLVAEAPLLHVRLRLCQANLEILPLGVPSFYLCQFLSYSDPRRTCVKLIGTAGAIAGAFHGGADPEGARLVLGLHAQIEICSERRSR
mmetsp:Transcript_47230/g.85147  ORF Transcript_47230/g.85147 Transcript_47230/m.85147 type:complete len:263 (-) Transcript_47230:852-1640(-)